MVMLMVVMVVGDSSCSGSGCIVTVIMAGGKSALCTVSIRL